MIRAFQFLCKLCRVPGIASKPGSRPGCEDHDLERRLDRMTEVRPVSVARAVLFRTRR